MLLQHVEGNHGQGAFAVGRQRGGASQSVVVGPKPVQCGDTLAVAGRETGNPVLRHRRRQVVADGPLVREELDGRDCAENSATDVRLCCGAAAVAVEADHGLGAAGIKRAIASVAISHGNQNRRFVRTRDRVPPNRGPERPRLA